MGQAIPVRTDYTVGEVRRLAKRAKDAAQTRRLLAIAAVLDGASREEAATIHGVVRWRACDLIMRLYEEFGLSVSDDTIYRALKNLGFSHMSARPKAYKQEPEVVEAFKNFAARVAE